MPRSVGGLGLALQIMLGLVAILGVAGMVLGVIRMGLIGDAITAPDPELIPALQTSDNLVVGWAVLYVPTRIALIVLFIVWLWRARANAELYTPGAEQTRHRLWIIFGWITPIVNLWIPFQLVRDTSAASRPADADFSRPDPTFRLIRTWWLALVVMFLVDRIYSRLPIDTLEQLRTEAGWWTAASGIELVAAVLAGLMVRRITAQQDQRNAEFLEARSIPASTRW